MRGQRDKYTGHLQRNATFTKNTAIQGGSIKFTYSNTQTDSRNLNMNFSTGKTISQCECKFRFLEKISLRNLMIQKTGFV